MREKPLSILLVNHLFLKRELQSLGYRVLTVAFGRDDVDCAVQHIGTHFSEIFEQLGETPDRIVVYDDSRSPWASGLEELSIPRVFLSIDTHHHSFWHREYAKLFDHLLVAQRAYLSHFTHPSIEWFPLWTEQEPQPQMTRTRDVVFRGNLDPRLHPERAKFFEEVSAFVPIDVQVGDWVEPYGSAKIVLNQAISADMNFRVFEALGSGAMLLTPRNSSGMEELFEEGIHYVSYEAGNAADAVAKIRMYLDDDATRSTIAAAGRARFVERHTALHRAKRLAEVLEGLTSSEKSTPELSALRAWIPSLVALEKYGASDARERAARVAGQLLKSVLRAPQFPSTPQENADSGLVLLALYSSNLFSELEELSQQLYLRGEVPEALIFELAGILGKGEEERAQLRAREASESPEELLASVPHLLGMVKRRLLGEKD